MPTQGWSRRVLAATAVGYTCATSPFVAVAGAPDQATDALQEIVVTATRREESISKVPISITALTQEAMDLKGIKDFQDVARFTPGVQIDANQTNQISIRGIASSGGAGTTGIYIDETPIQMRAMGFNPDEALPKTFDLDRVEVLRGPQGTLFGAGAEGGAVRYITPQPSLTDFTRERNSLSRKAARPATRRAMPSAARLSTARSGPAQACGIAATAAGSTALIRPHWRL
jgi:outer membrane receptor for ferrienterochelin and colicin